MTSKKIGLKKFGFSLIKCLLLATPIPIFTNHFFPIIGNLFSQKKKIENYVDLLPPSLQGEKFRFLSKERFIFLCLFFVLLYSFFSYLCESQAEKLIIRLSSYIKNQLLRKFRHLKFEERLKRKEQINSLVEIENNLVAKH